MKNYKAIIFDLDGTLLNTIEDITESLSYACEKNGLKMIYFVGNKKRVLKEKIDEIYSEENTFDKLEKLWESLKS